MALVVKVKAGEVLVLNGAKFQVMKYTELWFREPVHLIRMSDGKEWTPEEARKHGRHREEDERENPET